MINLSCILSANAGMAINIGGHTMLVDAFHDKKVNEFSTMSPALIEKVFESPDFRWGDALCFTHVHPDHFSKDLCARYMKENPGTPVLIPEEVFPGQMLITGAKMHISSGEIKVEFCKLIHEGEEYVDVPHYGICIETGGARVIIVGDAAVAGSDVAEWISGKKIDLAILPFTWTTLLRGRKFINDVMKPKHLLINHLPFAEDDKSDFQKISMKYSDRINCQDVRFLTKSLQKEEYILS